jgi:hypothetical protein
MNGAPEVSVGLMYGPPADVELRADQGIEITDSADGGDFVITIGDDEEFFCGGRSLRHRVPIQLAPS